MEEEPLEQITDLVYKLRKPVTLPFLDFSTPSLREHYCGRAPHQPPTLPINLDVVPLYQLGERYSFAGPGPVADHAVMPLVRYRAMVSAKVAALATRDEGVEKRDRHSAADSGLDHFHLDSATVERSVAALLVAAR